MPGDAHALGELGERAVEQWLAARGRRVLARRYKTRFGEIDLVVAFRGRLAAVEVKTRQQRSTARFGSPETWIHPTQVRRLVRALSCHPASKSALCLGIDAASVTVRSRDQTWDVVQIDYFEDIADDEHSDLAPPPR